MASRSWSTGPAALVYGYDGAKRVIRECNGAAGACGSPAQIDIERSYDRAGNVTAETQNLRAGSGTSVAGADQQGTQSFTYDALNRVLTSTLGTITKAYTYDSDGNRLTVTEGGLTVDTFAFDTTDQTISENAVAFSYDEYGNLTSSSTSAASVTTYASDLADRMTTITEPDGTQVVFTFDAAGRHATRTATNGQTVLTDTYAYLGSTNSVIADVSSVTGKSVYAAIDSMGDRLASSTAPTAGTLAWIVPDLHGNVVAQCRSNGTDIIDAFRYDAYGKTIGSDTSLRNVASPWRFQGRLLMSTAGGTNADVYDFSARAYVPDLGTFTSLDSVAGSAQSPLTLNRYLYALANPATMIDPSGHVARIMYTDSSDIGERNPFAGMTIKTWYAMDNPALRRDFVGTTIGSVKRWNGWGDNEATVIAALDIIQYDKFVENKDLQGPLVTVAGNIIGGKNPLVSNKTWGDVNRSASDSLAWSLIDKLDIASNLVDRPSALLGLNVDMQGGGGPACLVDFEHMTSCGATSPQLDQELTDGFDVIIPGTGAAVHANLGGATQLSNSFVANGLDVRGIRDDGVIVVSGNDWVSLLPGSTQISSQTKGNTTTISQDGQITNVIYITGAHGKINEKTNTGLGNAFALASENKATFEVRGNPAGVSVNGEQMEPVRVWGGESIWRFVSGGEPLE